MPAPIGNKPATIQSTPKADSTIAPTSTPVAVPAGPTVWSGVGQTVNDQFTKLSGNLAGGIRSQTKSDVDLIPGRYPTNVSLPQLLQAMGQTPQGQAAVGQLVEALKAKTGIAVPPEVMAAIKENPSALLKAFEVTPEQLSAGFAAMNAAHKAGKLKNDPSPVNQLPQHFDLGNLDATAIKRGEPEMKEIAPGIYSGDVKSDLPDAQAKKNIVSAEIFQRLSANASAPKDQQFSVSLNGKNYTHVDTFLKGLRENGYEVNVKFDQRIANFAALKTAIPGTNPPQLVDVPCPVMVKTGVKDAQGNEAVVPTAHSEMVISIKSGPNTKGPKLDSDIKYYQGVSGTGFFPCDLTKTPEWCGHSTHGGLKGEQALKAINLAGAFTDVVNTTAKKMDLYAGGYGVTGVCNDSVALIEEAMTGKPHSYPLIMIDSVLMGEVNKRLKDTDKRDDHLYQDLSKAIRNLPSDTRQTPSTKQRALASIPWVSGNEPFQSTVDARKILGN